MTRRWMRLLAILMSFALVAAACGGDDDDEASGGTETEASGESGSTDGGGGDDDSADDEPAPTTTAIEAGTESEGDVDTEVVESDEVASQGGEVIIGLEAESVGLRPWEDTCSSPCVNMMLTLYDRLMQQKSDGSYGGWLYEDMTANDDFTIWTANLRSGVTFHNGSDLTAQSIADMFPIQQEGATGAGDISASGLTGVEATGDLEVTYTLARSNSAFPAFLSRTPLGFVFDPVSAAADQDAFNENPIGTGPFMFVSRDLDNETVVERNPSYWKTDENGTQLPYLDTVSFRPIPDEGTRLDALLSGTTNAMQTLRQGTIRDARNARDGGEDIALFEFQGNNVGGGQFNTLVPPYDDVRVRRGLTHMNSQDNVIEALGGTGISLPGSQWFSPDSVWYSEKVAAAWPQFDFDLGVSTLQEYIDDPDRSDGRSPGERIEVELSCPPDPTLIAAMQVIEQTWSASGLVDINLTNYDQQTHINYALGAENGFLGEHGAHCWRWSDDEDPSLSLNTNFAPPTQEIVDETGFPGPAPLNFHNWFDTEVFGNLITAVETDDFDERYALYEAVNLKIAEEVPIWFSGHTATAIGVEADIKGLNSWTLPNGDLGNGHPAAVGLWSHAWIDG